MSTNKKTKNEMLIIDSIPLIDYYNDNITPLGAKYEPMSVERTTAICPFHVDTDPSLHFWKKKNIFHCFGCGFGGDVVYTHMRIRKQYHNEGLTKRQAIEQLSKMYKIDLYDEEEGFQEESVFSRAKRNLLDKDTYVIPKGEFSLAEYKQLNSKVIESKVKESIKVQNYAQLDLVASNELTKG